MNWYRRAQEDDSDLLDEAFLNFKTIEENELRQKILENIDRAVRSEISKKVPSAPASDPFWWHEHVSIRIETELKSEGWPKFENQAEVQALAERLANAALVGNTTTTWNWMDHSLEWDPVLFSAMISLIGWEWIHDENSLELALECYDDTISEGTISDPGKLAMELRRRMEQKEKAEPQQGNIKTWFVKAMGSFTYDKSGITYPGHVPVNWNHILRNVGGKRWANQFGWSNQPKVLVFEGTNDQAKQVGDELPDGLLAILHWKYDKPKK